MKASVGERYRSAATVVTVLVTLSVLPPSSVTVSVTVVVARRARRCGSASPRCSCRPSPKSQAYDAMVPSVSVEPDPSKVTARSVHVDVKAAVGLAFGAVT